jgi:hypothetical protein
MTHYVRQAAVHNIQIAPLQQFGSDDLGGSMVG